MLSIMISDADEQSRYAFGFELVWDHTRAVQISAQIRARVTGWLFCFVFVFKLINLEHSVFTRKCQTETLPCLPSDKDITLGSS